jgi:hypothetical protein
MIYPRWLAVVASALLLPSAVRAEPELESDVDKQLEQAIEQDRAVKEKPESAASAAPASSSSAPQIQTDASTNAAMSLILDTVGGWFSTGNHPHQDGHALNDTGTKLQGLELAASASVDPYFRFDMNFQIADLDLEEGYVTTMALPANLQMRAGLFNMAFGRQNPQHLHVWSFVNPPFMQTRFLSAEHFRGVGTEASVLLPLPWYVVVLGQAVAPTDEARFNSASFALVEKTSQGRIASMGDLVYLARLETFLELSHDWSLLVGADGSFGLSSFVPDARASLWGADLYLKWRPISRGRGDIGLALTAEGVLRDTRVPSGRMQDWGAYTQLDALLSRQWMAGVRFDATNIIDGDQAERDAAGGWQRRASAVLTFLPTHFSKVRLQGDVERAQGRDGLVYAVFLQAEVSAGAHGAHRF